MDGAGCHEHLLKMSEVFEGERTIREAVAIVATTRKGRDSACLPVHAKSSDRPRADVMELPVLEPDRQGTASASGNLPICHEKKEKKTSYGIGRHSQIRDADLGL